MQELWLVNGKVISHCGVTDADIKVIAGKISEIIPREGSKIQASDNAQIIDCQNLLVLPGIIDSQVHFREPGLEDKETLQSGSRAAVLGGVTTVFEMPNTKPLTINLANINDKINRAKSMFCDHAFFVGATAENIDQLRQLEKIPGICGIKIFMGASTGDLLVSNDKTLEKILLSGKSTVSIHAEDEDILLEEKKYIVANDPTSHPLARSPQAAFNATKRIINLAEKTKRKIHILHITTKQEVEYLAKKKYICSAEVTPQHLTFCAPDVYHDHGTNAQMNPPIRTCDHREALWQGLRTGVFDVVGSDHAPHEKSEKQKQYPYSPSGIPGVQTILPIMYNNVSQGKLSIMKLVDLLCTSPARIFGLHLKGKIAKGYDADFTIIDPNLDHVITNEEQASKAGYSLYTNMKLKGYPVYTIIRGKVVVNNGKIIGEPSGKIATFHHNNLSNN